MKRTNIDGNTGNAGKRIRTADGKRRTRSDRSDEDDDEDGSDDDDEDDDGKGVKTGAAAVPARAKPGPKPKNPSGDDGADTPAKKRVSRRRQGSKPASKAERASSRRVGRAADESDVKKKVYHQLLLLFVLSEPLLPHTLHTRIRRKEKIQEKDDCEWWQRDDDEGEGKASGPQCSGVSDLLEDV